MMIYDADKPVKLGVLYGIVDITYLAPYLVAAAATALVYGFGREFVTITVLVLYGADLTLHPAEISGLHAEKFTARAKGSGHKVYALCAAMASVTSSSFAIPTTKPSNWKIC
ncbi:hypothetical protein DPSP01_011104 [Paraphaeosphaeria sporulosa]